MRKIITIGETLYDIIFKQHKPVDAKAGGAMLNTSVSLGRVGMPIYFISEYASDPVGKLINEFLTSNGVCTEFVTHYHGQTALALAFLDEFNNAEYVFYKQYPAQRLASGFPEINENDIVLFGSFFAISPEIRFQMKNVLKYAKERNALIIYDPNFRRSHVNELDSLRPIIIENIELADIVRASDEDFKFVFNAVDFSASLKIADDFNCRNLIYTTKEKVFLNSFNFQKKFDVPDIATVSTIGAGDNFNAGLIYSLMKNSIDKNNLHQVSDHVWSKMIQNAIGFALDVCMSYENYISENFAKNLLEKEKLI